jgi:outer membrane receptor for ferrienterochelin and colicin
MRIARPFVALALMVGLALPALGQGNPTAKLTGRVTSEGTPLPGVTVTATSDNLQGKRITTTSANGDYLFPSLPPGDYTITFELQGLDSVQVAARLSAAQSANVNAEMVASAVAEEIVVTSSLEAISQSSQAATTYTQDLIDKLPAGRSITEIVALAPGIHATGPSKSSENNLGPISVSGAATFENLFLVNGVVVNENIRGGANDLFIEDAIQETTTATSGVSAEFGRFAGGVVNVITKSGGNAFSGSLRTSFRNQDWSEETPLTTTVTDDIVPIYEATLGGPVLRDRLWFFVAGRDFEEITTANTSITNLAFDSGRDEQRYEGKLTLSLTDAHNLVGSYMKLDEIQYGNNFPPIMDLRSISDRETPEELLAFNYNGSLTSNLFVTAQYSEREFTFINSGSRFTDRIFGTLLLDRSRNNARYWSPTFCGVCRPEQRNNENYLAKASYFLSSESLGTHDLVVGYDAFNDIRVSDNHQSGSDYRIFGTAAIIQGDQIYPVFDNNGSTWIQFNPISVSSRGTNFETHSIFVNDAWRLNDQWAFNLGVRWDKNDGTDGGGAKVADDSNISPRLAVTFDPKGGDMVFHLSYAKYVAALANNQGDAASAGGVPATFRWAYGGPDINVDPNAPLLGPEEALSQLWAWWDSIGGPNNTLPTLLVDIPGGNTRINGSLDSPSVDELSLGATLRIGSRGQLRADYVHREYGDFYAERTDRTTGQLVQPGTGRRFDINLIENNNEDPERVYDGLHTQFRFGFSKLDIGGNWTWSHARGNFDGETRVNGPVRFEGGKYPEFKDPRWNNPRGDLLVDQRHRVNLYAVYTLFENDRQSVSVSGLQHYSSGRPYEAIGAVDTRPFVPDLGYASEPATVAYYFTGRGELLTPDIYRTDLSISWELRIGKLDVFIEPEVVNVFNADDVDTTATNLLDQSVFTASNSGATSCNGTRCLAFNPFTETPVEGVHWAKGPNFGQAINPLAFQQPRTYRLSVGIRF